MFEKLVGTISGIREGIEATAAAKKQDAARIREERREAAKMAKAAAAAEKEVAKAAAKKISKEKLGRSKTVARVIELGAAAVSSRDALAGVVERGQELHQKIQGGDPDDKLAALVGIPSAQTPEHEQSQSPSVFGRGGLPPV